METRRREFLTLAGLAGLAGCIAPTDTADSETQKETMTDRTPRHFNDQDELTSDVNNQSVRTNELSGSVTGGDTVTNIHGTNFARQFLTPDYSGPVLLGPHPAELNGQNWNAEKYAGNPIITNADSSTTYDHIGLGSVVIVDGTWHMYWEGVNNTGPSYDLHHATSQDGINWTQDANNPVISGIANAHVIKAGSTWQMWGQSDSGGIYYYESSDGSSWSVPSGVSNPVLSSAAEPFVHRFGDGDYRMWFKEDVDGDGSSEFGYATSSDGVSWTKSNNNPIFSGGGNWWDSSDVLFPSPYWTGNGFVCFYVGKNSESQYTGMNPSKIGMAHSTDGINWSESATNPLLDITQDWEELSDGSKGEVELGHVVNHNGRLFVYYDAWFGNPTGIGVAIVEPNADDDVTVDGFEDGGLSEYSGDTSYATVDSTSPVYDGSNSLKLAGGTAPTGRIISTSGLGGYPAFGDTYVVDCSIEAASAQIGAGYFVRDGSNFYLVQLDHGAGAMKLYVKSGGAFTSLSSASVSLATGTPYRIEMMPEGDHTHTARLYQKSTGERLAEVTATDGTFSSGGVVFRNGSKDNGAVFDNAQIL